MALFNQRQLNSILQRALELPDDAREAFVTDACRHDNELRATLDRMLEACEADDSPLTPGGAMAGRLWEELCRRYSAVALDAGDCVGAYRVARTLGHGGTATVYLAERADGQFEQRVALKILHPSKRVADVLRRFEQERQILASLDHPNIARLVDGGVTSSGQPFVAMEYVEGEAVDSYCDREKLTVHQRLLLFMQVADAVQHAHRNLIIHRDIKPSNILVAEHGVPKLLDFGIAKLLGASLPHAAPETRTMAHPMTPEYASPEQVRGKPLTTGSDVYQLGYLLYQLVAGRRPYCVDRRDYAAVLDAICHRDAVRPSQAVMQPMDSDADPGSVAGARSSTPLQLQRELRGDLDAIVLKALRKEPGERYRTVIELASDLEACLEHRPITARRADRWYVLRRFVRRHRAGAAATAAVVLVVAAAMIAVTAAWHEATRQQEEADRQRAAAVFQARRAESANDFLNVLLLSEGGRTTSAPGGIGRLEIGVQMIERQYSQQDPSFAGRMLVQLGHQFRGLHDTGRAVRIYDEAYELGRRTADDELMALATCAAAYAEALALAPDRTAPRLEEARRLMGRMPQPDALLRASCLRAEARLEHYRENDDAAVARLTEARQLLEESGDDFRMTYTQTLTDLGGIHLRRGRLADALELAEQVLATHERFGRGDTSAHMNILHNISVVLYRLGEVLAAHALRTEIAARLPLLEPEGAVPLNYPVMDARVLNRLGRPEEALQVLEGIVSRAREAGNATWLAGALFNAGWAQVQLGREAEATVALDEAASLLQRAGSSYTDLLSEIGALRARLALARGDTASALEEMDRALAVTGYPERTEGVATPVALTAAAALALDLQRFDEAGRYANAALGVAEAVARGRETSANVGEALAALGRARLALGLTDEARPILERAVLSLDNALGADHPATLDAQRLLLQLARQ